MMEQCFAQGSLTFPGDLQWPCTSLELERRLEVNEMWMLRWMCGVTKKDKVRNKRVRGSVKVAPVTKKITEKRLKWYGMSREGKNGTC